MIIKYQRCFLLTAAILIHLLIYFSLNYPAFQLTTPLFG